MNEWRYLDEIIIPKDKKQLYKEDFQQYQEKQGPVATDPPDQLGSQPSQGLDQNVPGKEGKKRGRKNLQKSIYMVSDFLVNSGKVVPLSMVFHQINKLSQ